MSEMSQGPGTGRGVPWWLVAVAAFVAVIVGAGVMVVVTRDDDDTTASGDTQQLVLEPIGTTGTDPFTESVATEEVAVLTAVSAPAGEEDEPLEVAGSQPGLYGGTQNETACDAAALVEFLEANPDKAAAWAGVQGIAPDAIRDYIAGLTPVLLRTDTRVTNHGFANGQATPRQSVFQAGTAVMVDTFGVPRVRCSCGNPLTEPAPLPQQLPTATADGTITLVGQPWQTWNPEIVVVVNATIEITNIVLLDIETEQEYTIPVGTNLDTPTTATKILLLPDGLGLTDADGNLTETLPFGTPMAQVRATLTEILGQPTAEQPPSPNNAPDCPVSMIRWNELSITVKRDTFHSWLVATVNYDPQTDEPVPVEVRGITQTPEGITLGSTTAEVLAAYPNATETQINVGRIINYTDATNRHYSISPREGDAVHTINTNPAGVC